MRFSIADVGRHSLLVRLSYLALVGLVSCARANPPEEFVADPALQDDFTNSLPATGSSLGYEYAIIQGIAILEGDILLGRVDSDGQLIDRFQARGVGKNDAFSRWPDGNVIYEKPVNSSQIQQDNIEEAIAHWVENTTISFIERTPENADQYPHYIQFLDTQSCASHVGMIGQQQPVYLADACSVGSVIHEIGHAIGLFHEHTRFDRDNFVQVDYDNIISGKEINFNLQTANTDTYSPYDYGSIMHYGEDFFSISGGPTIIVADGIDIGQREALSPLDIESVNNMYQTDLALSTPATQSTDSGLEIDITTYNYGSLGANSIELMLRLGDDSQWKGVSRDSGWECLTFGPELKCTRDTFREQTQSRIVILADMGSATADDLSVRLVSRTQDSDLSNNAFNDEDGEWQSAGLDLTDPSPDEQGAVDSVQDIDEPESDGNSPSLSSANEARTNETGAANDSAGGGGIQLPMLALLATMAGIRRRRSQH